MFCTNCGKGISIEDKFCQFCGKQNENYLVKEVHTINPTVVDSIESDKAYKEPTKAFAVLALVFGLLGGWFGLLFAIIGLRVYDKERDKGKRIMCYVGIFAFVVWVLMLIAQNI